MRLSADFKKAISAWLDANGQKEAKEIHIEAFPTKIIITSYFRGTARMELLRPGGMAIKTGYYIVSELLYAK